MATLTLLHCNAAVQIDNANIVHGGYSGGSMEKRDETISNQEKKMMRQ
jgi:hypothetical protein